MDSEITFSDGAYQHTFDVRADITTSARFGEPTVENGYEVTPYYFTITATIGEKTLTNTRIIDICIKRCNSLMSAHIDGTVDAEVTIINDDGTTETFIASEAFGSMFTFDFSEAEIDRNDEVVSYNNYKLSAGIGEAISSKQYQQGNWVVTEKLYPYTIVFDNGIEEDKIAVTYTFKNYEFAFTHSRTGTVKLAVPDVQMSYTYEFKAQSQIDGAYNVDNWKLDISAVVRATRGTYRLSKSQSVDVKYLNVFVPTEPHLGKAKAFYVTAVYDPEEGATKRAFISLWEKGVKFSVCDFDRLFLSDRTLKVCLDTYAGYNAIGYDPDATYHWRPARCERIGNTLYWYRSDGTIMSTMTESECQAVGWKNVVDGQYAIEVPGYSYSITDLGYVIEYFLPDGKKKKAFGTYVQSIVVTY